MMDLGEKPFKGAEAVIGPVLIATILLPRLAHRASSSRCAPKPPHTSSDRAGALAARVKDRRYSGY
jgi:hypothetical protein